jgi:hypothetical protein
MVEAKDEEIVLTEVFGANKNPVLTGLPPTLRDL